MILLICHGDTKTQRILEMFSQSLCASVATLFKEHRGPFELDHNCTVWFLSPTLDPYDAGVGSRFRFALLDDLAFRIDRIAVKDGMGMYDLIVAQICHNCTFCELWNRQADHQSKRIYPVDQSLSKLCFGCKV